MRFRFHSGFGLVSFLAIAGIPALLRGQSPVSPALGSAASFAVMGGSSVISTGSTVVTGNLGVSPGNAISGSPTVKVGAIHRNDSVARQAQRDATSAYNDLAGRTCNATLSTDLGGLTLGPGVYCFTSTAQLSGTLVLDAANDAEAVWIFRIGSTLTTAPGSSVRVTNGGYESQVFWQIGNSATLGAGTAFLGNVLALKDITFGSGATVSGRLLAQGTVSLDANNVSLCCAHITLSPATLPNGIEGTPYASVTITADGGIKPFTFTAVSQPPLPGVTLSASGVLSGTPTTAGHFTFTVTATDATQVCSGTPTYAIDVACPGNTAISPSAIPPTPGVPFVLPPARACSPYIVKFGDGCTLPHHFVLTPAAPSGGPVPSELDPQTGVLDWVPKTSGVYTFTVSDGSVSQIYTIAVACEAISISPLTLPDGQVCAIYDAPITAAGCDPLYVLSLESGLLPPGVILTGNAIRGTPTNFGMYSFTIKATAADDPACFVTRDYSIQTSCPPITISPNTLPPAIVGQNYGVQLSPSCAVGKTAFSVPATDLPPGLLLSDAGLLFGLPSAPGIYPFTVTFIDSVSGCTGSVMYTLTVVSCVTITPLTLPGGTPGVLYNRVLTASGGVAPYIFSLSGPLTAGLTFTQTTPTTATITGIPVSPGCSTFSITATDVNGATGCTPVTYTICIAADGPTLTGWGMVVLSILLVGVGWVAIRRGGL
ncbi:MAG TPA: ice-binding family protein [Thermoanaerobaculia bacterium]|jgi:hypothetical protein|nr:ice-binding family protein [Thermoanaerobaculia bacterium]